MTNKGAIRLGLSINQISISTSQRDTHLLFSFTSPIHIACQFEVSLLHSWRPFSHSDAKKPWENRSVPKLLANLDGQQLVGIPHFLQEEGIEALRGWAAGVFGWYVHSTDPLQWAPICNSKAAGKSFSTPRVRGSIALEAVLSGQPHVVLFGLENPLGHVTLQFAQPVRLFVQVLLDLGNYGGRKNGGEISRNWSGGSIQ